MSDPVDLYLRIKAAQTQTELAGLQDTTTAPAAMVEMSVGDVEIALLASEGGMFQTTPSSAGAMPLYWGT